ncbi:MAG: L-rhamnose catabolism isomerase [Planctomycetota bacterium]|nr:MAG: L-rhamnose catabolism isomerase [Planctomycetota bacterium]
MSGAFRIAPDFVEQHNRAVQRAVEPDFRQLAERLARRGVDAEELLRLASGFAVAVPSWGVGTGGTRFARFPGPGEPRDVLEKLDDCATVHALVRCTPTVSLHIPWDAPEDAAELAEYARERGLGFDAMNSNTFQDQAGQAHSYKHGSLTHTDPAVRRQAIEHNLRCIDIGRRLGSKALTLWIGDGANLPGQHNFRDALERYLDSARRIYAALPADWRLFLEHKLYEPAFYATVLNDWGTSYWCARELGPQALCLVDLGHHAPNTNIEMIVSRLIQFGKLGGFHFNDSKYGDDDLDSGSIHPFQLFLIFHELVDAAQRDSAFHPAYMLDQSHNVTDPLESLMASAMELQRAHVQALLVDRAALRRHQEANDALMAHRSLKEAFTTDVAPLLAEARRRAGGAIDPVGCFRASGYRARKDAERPQARRGGSGIV